MSHFNYKQHQLHAENVSIEAIAKEVPTPFYCYSTQAIVSGYDTYLRSFEGMDVQMRFAMRANPNIAILRQLYRLGAGTECVSGNELARAIKAGIDGSKIVFSGMVKTPEEIAFALKNDVSLIIIETEPELELIENIAASLNTKAHIAIRVGLELDNRSNKHVTLSRYDTKYGIEWPKVRAVYQQIAQYKHLVIRGISTHLGSQFVNPMPFQVASKRLATLVEMLRSEGHPIEYVDLGGGLENAYAGEGLEHVKEFADILVKIFSGAPYKLLVSPGQVIMADAAILVTKSLLVRRQPQRNVMAIDASLCDFLHPDLRTIDHDMIPVALPEKNEKERVDIVARVLGNSELIAKKRSLPKLETGALYAFRSVGAYAASMDVIGSATESNASQVLVDDTQYALTSKHVPFHEQSCTDMIPPWL